MGLFANATFESETFRASNQTRETGRQVADAFTRNVRIDANASVFRRSGTFGSRDNVFGSYEAGLSLRASTHHPPELAAGSKVEAQVSRDLMGDIKATIGAEYYVNARGDNGIRNLSGVSIKPNVVPDPGTFSYSHQNSYFGVSVSGNSRKLMADLNRIFE